MQRRLLPMAVWSGITAVNNNDVYANPLGVFPWDRYSCEGKLQVLWAAQKLSPSTSTALATATSLTRTRRT